MSVVIKFWVLYIIAPSWHLFWLWVSRVCDTTDAYLWLKLFSVIFINVISIINKVFFITVNMPCSKMSKRVKRRRTAWREMCRMCDPLRSHFMWSDGMNLYRKGAYIQSDVSSRNWTELNWQVLVFDELTNEQAVLYYSKQWRIQKFGIADGRVGVGSGSGA